MLRQALITDFLLLLLCCAPPLASAQDAAALPAQTQEGDSIEQLLKKNYSSRQQATLEMWRQRESSRDQVQEAARHPDPEVSQRAKWILRQWRRGSLPDTPPEISRLLQQGDGPAAVQRLLEGGQFTATVVALEESAGTIDRETIEKRITSALTLRFPIYVHLAAQNDSLAGLLKLIDLVADSKEMAVCRIQLMQQMGLEIDANALLPESASSWSPIERDRATALVWITLGKVDEAIRVANGSVDKELLRQCRMIAGRWSEAAEDSLQLAREAEAGTYEHARLWSLTMIAADRAGDAEIFAEAVKQLSLTETTDDDLASELRWKCLASHGEVDAAFEILDKVSPDASASVAIDASRTARAFDVLGFPLDRLDLDMKKWVDSAITAQRESKSDDLTEDVRKVLVLLQCLISVGRNDAAWYIAKRMSLSDVEIGALRLREFVLSTLTMTRRTDWIVQLATFEGEKALSPTSQHTLTRSLPDTDGESFGLVMEVMSRLMPGVSLDRRVQATYQLCDGEIPAGFDRDVGFKSLYEYVSRPTSSRQVQLRRRLESGLRLPVSMNIVSLFSRHGESDYASACLQKMAQSGDIEAIFHLAEQELDRGRATTALSSFQSVFDAVAEQGRRGGRLSSDDVALAVKALIGSWTIARRSGDDQQSDELLREIRLALCSPSTALRSAVADYLGERGEAILAMEAYEVLLPMALFGNQESTGLYDVARSYSLLARKTNPTEAARWFDLAVGGTLDSVNYRPGAYITLPLYVRRWAIEAAIGQNYAEQVQHHLQRILKLDPLDIDFAERLLPEMREAGMDELADQALNEIVDRGLDYTEAFPFDAMSSNNLAWVAAMNQSRLIDALELAERAVYAEPDSAIYRDTLAEVLFLLDRKVEALQVERACLLDDPSQWHLHEQVKKYQAAVENDGSS
jgi:tetratricopeptide (TPR) repeat protein